MATLAEGYEDRRVSMGRVFELAFSTILHNPLVTLGLALAVGAIPTLLVNYVYVSVVVGGILTGMSSAARAAVYGAMVVLWLLLIIIGAMVQGALTKATVAEADGRRAGFGESVGAGLRVAPQLVGLSLLVALGSMLGMILLIVPGVILYLMWSVSMPSLVEEREGVFMALGRSQQLTKGARWKIFAIFLVVFVAYWLVAVAAAFAGLKAYDMTAVGGPTVSNLLGGIILGTVLNVALGTIQPSLYVELRQWKEGGTVGHLEQVFS